MPVNFVFYADWPDGPGLPSSEMVNAIASLVTAVQWPLVALIISAFFRRPIIRMLGRIRSAKAFGAEAEFREEVEELQESVESHTPLVASGSLDPIDRPDKPVEKQFYTNREMLDLARQHEEDAFYKVLDISPSAAVMLVSAYIESTIRSIAYRNGIMRIGAKPPLRQLLFKLLESNILPRYVIDDVQSFMRIKSIVSHGETIPSRDVIAAAKTGMTLWKLIVPIDTELSIDSMILENLKSSEREDS